MTLIVNGEPRIVPTGMDVAALVTTLGHDPDRPGAAVACNGEVVPRTRWRATVLAEGDSVEVVAASAGG